MITLPKIILKRPEPQKVLMLKYKTPGEGTAIDSGKGVTVDYKGMTLDGKVFDESYDSSGKSIKPFTFVIDQRGAIPGWSDGLVYFKKGGKGRLFIPSYLAYGPRGAGADIKPNTPIMFDISIVDVLTHDEYQKKMEDRQKMMQLQQQFNKDKMVCSNSNRNSNRSSNHRVNNFKNYFQTPDFKSIRRLCFSVSFKKCNSFFCFFYIMNP